MEEELLSATPGLKYPRPHFEQTTNDACSGEANDAQLRDTSCSGGRDSPSDDATLPDNESSSSDETVSTTASASALGGMQLGSSNTYTNFIADQNTGMLIIKSLLCERY